MFVKIHERVMRTIRLHALWLALLAAVLVLFPFDWLSEVWPAFGRIFDRIFVSEREHTIGHATLFWLAGLLVLCSMPQLRRHPLLLHTPHSFGGIGRRVSPGPQQMANSKLWRWTRSQLRCAWVCAGLSACMDMVVAQGCSARKNEIEDTGQQIDGHAEAQRGRAA